MTATVQHSLGRSRFPASRELPVAFGRAGRLASIPSDPVAAPTNQWPVDLTALARCRALCTGHASASLLLADAAPNESLMDVPRSYDAFCRAHFASVRRVHPELDWDDARPAYAIALAAHAVLCEALDDEREQVLAAQWERIRGRSTLAWAQARPLVADGCQALNRLDPLAMHR
jgi:hypothetical protein